MKADLGAPLSLILSRAGERVTCPELVEGE
jgi:hypothetical protein